MKQLNEENNNVNPALCFLNNVTEMQSSQVISHLFLNVTQKATDISNKCFLGKDIFGQDVYVMDCPFKCLPFVPFLKKNGRRRLCDVP